MMDERPQPPLPTEADYGAPPPTAPAGNPEDFGVPEVQENGEAAPMSNFTVPSTPVEIPTQMNGEDDTAPLGDPFHKLPAPPLPRGLMPPILEAFAERETRIKGVEFAAPAMAALTVCAAAIPDHITRNRLLLITQLRTFRTELGMTACDPTRKWDERPQLS